MKKYCFDTSGLSNPLQHMPQDLHTSLWTQIRSYLRSGQVAVTTEIFDELVLLPGEIGQFIKVNKINMLLEIGDGDWNWQAYVKQSNALIYRYREFISEYNNNTKRTVGVTDISIIALASTLSVPAVSMESPALMSGNTRAGKRRIPDICDAEQIEHLWFNDFLRREGIIS